MNRPFLQLQWLASSLYIPLILLCSITACRPVPHHGQVIIEHDGWVYRGGMQNGQYEGYGQLSYHDSIVYAGQWHAGQRSGRGISRDSLGSKIIGLWNGDTLLTGTSIAADGSVYQGELDSMGIASGYGMKEWADGRFYEGNWSAGQRTGLGFDISPQGSLHLGEWRQDRYLGERLEYSSQRIYGIDISRFQHDIGKQTYPIDWSRMRITHLGTISKKRVADKVDYHVSFVFIKSTEGTTIRNKYYATDYAAARRHGIPVGAYHFFSTKSAATAQARYFLANTRFQKGDFPPVLDVEPSDAQIQAMGGDEPLFKAIRTWMAIVEQHTGVRPVLYISQNFVNRHLVHAPDIKQHYDVWIARYGEYKPDVHLVYWQLCPDGRVAGIHGDVDINVFNGYHGRFQEYLYNNCIGSQP